MELTEALVDSWDRQCRIVNSVAQRVTESNRDAKPSADGWPLFRQLAHIHLVRRYWLCQVDPERGNALPNTFTDGWKTPISDLTEIKRCLQLSATAVREAVEVKLAQSPLAVGGYDHPVLFLQHMIWHEGWHVGLIMLGLRLAGEEPSEEWEEEHVWSEWRTEQW